MKLDTLKKANELSKDIADLKNCIAFSRTISTRLRLDSYSPNMTMFVPSIIQVDIEKIMYAKMIELEKELKAL